MTDRSKRDDRREASSSHTKIRICAEMQSRFQSSLVTEKPTAWATTNRRHRHTRDLFWRRFQTSTLSSACGAKLSLPPLLKLFLKSQTIMAAKLLHAMPFIKKASFWCKLNSHVRWLFHKLLYTTLTMTTIVMQVMAVIASISQRYLNLLLTTCRRKIGPGCSLSASVLLPWLRLPEATDERLMERELPSTTRFILPLKYNLMYQSISISTIAINHIECYLRN